MRRDGTHLKYVTYEACINDTSCKMITTPSLALTKYINEKEQHEELTLNHVMQYHNERTCKTITWEHEMKKMLKNKE
jgi:hypothetical protein